MRSTCITPVLMFLVAVGCAGPAGAPAASKIAPAKPSTPTTAPTQSKPALPAMTPVAAEPETRTDGARVVVYVPGLRIDYRVPQVEVDCEVILREGDLELLAYGKAPVPKEHESILRTAVPAERIFEALGLIGLRPGQTLKYLVETKTIRPATGDPVDVRVRYESEGTPREDSACAWMLDAAKKKPMDPTYWLFTGSERMENGEFAANYEGTIVTVVDFPSSLLSLPGSHSDSDDQLWLRANTAAIPPVGTKVTMLLRPAEH